MSEAFYVPAGEDRFESTAWTRGPWGPDSQHGGPPAALLARALERAAGENMRLVRGSFDILGPVPVAPVEVHVQPLRPGRRVALFGASLSSGGREVVSAQAWFMAVNPGASPPVQRSALVDRPEDGRELETFPEDYHPNYLEAVEWRFTRGSFLSPGPAIAWTRLRVPVVEGEEPSGFQRALALADSASGISAVLDFRRWLFVNTDLVVHFHRPPEGQWIRMDARTTAGPDGAGVTSSSLWDSRGEFGFGRQALLVAPRPTGPPDGRRPGGR